MCNAVRRGRGELQNLARWQTVASSNEQMKQIEDLTREAMGFSENAVIRSMLLTRRSIAVTKAGRTAVLATASVYRSVTCCRSWLLVLLVAWLLWRKAVRPQLHVALRR